MCFPQFMYSNCTARMLIAECAPRFVSTYQHLHPHFIASIISPIILSRSISSSPWPSLTPKHWRNKHHTRLALAPHTSKHRRLPVLRRPWTQSCILLFACHHRQTTTTSYLLQSSKLLQFHLNTFSHGRDWQFSKLHQKPSNPSSQGLVTKPSFLSDPLKWLRDKHLRARTVPLHKLNIQTSPLQQPNPLVKFLKDVKDIMLLKSNSLRHPFTPHMTSFVQPRRNQIHQPTLFYKSYLCIQKQKTQV